MKSFKIPAQQRQNFLIVWQNNKGTYLLLAGIFLLVSIFVVSLSFYQLATVDRGKILWVEVTKISESDGYRRVGSTDIAFRYFENDLQKEGTIHLPLTGYKEIAVGKKIPVAKDPKTGIIVAVTKEPYIMNLIVTSLLGLFCLLPFYYHFFVFKKLRRSD